MTVGFPLADYLRRVGLGRDDLCGLDDATLVERVATAQLATVPFENLDILRARPTSIDPDVMASALIAGHRGGICYQLNGVLLFALRALGVSADVVGARVRGGTVSPPLGHMAVLVHAADGDRLVDVGFGGNHVHRGIDLGAESDRTVTFPGGAAYVLESEPRELADFVAMAWWHSTSPASRFTGSLVCSRTVGGVRETLTDSADTNDFRLIRTDGEDRRVTVLDRARARDVLEHTFGVVVDEVPSVSPHPNRHGVGNGCPR